MCSTSSPLTLLCLSGCSKFQSYAGRFLMAAHASTQQFPASELPHQGEGKEELHPFNFHLLERLKERKMREFSQTPGSLWPKPGVCNSTQVSHGSGRAQQLESAACSDALAGSRIQAEEVTLLGGAVTPSGSLTRCTTHPPRFPLFLSYFILMFYACLL